MSAAMTFTDYIGFASMTLLIIGSANWGTVAIRYAAKDLTNYTDFQSALDSKFSGSATPQELYELLPTPDLLDLLGASATTQMIVYWTVFASGISYLLLFIWNSIEVRTVEP